MIAKVKIAPMEHWCEYEKKKQLMKQFRSIDYQAAVGFPIEIYIDQVKLSELDDCNGKLWRVTPESLQRLCEHTGATQDIDGMCFCEHMLEMD